MPAFSFVRHELGLASLRRLALRRLGVTASQLTDTDASTYPQTVAWAESARHAGFDGLAWTPSRGNDAPAVVLFGHRCSDAIVQEPTFARVFERGPGLDWLIDTCAALNIDVLPPTV